MERILINLLSHEPAARILEIAESIFGRILAAGIAISLLIAVILLLRFLLRNYRRSYSYCLWGSLGLLCCLAAVPGSVFRAAEKLVHHLTGDIPSGGIPMRIETWGHSVSHFFTPAHISEMSLSSSVSSESGTHMAAVSGQTPDIISDTQAPDVMPDPAGIPAADTVLLSDTEFLFALFTLIWLVGVVILIVLTIRSSLRVGRSVRFAVRTEEPDVWTSDQIQGTFVRGVFRARIYLPVSTDPKHRKYILLHERYHIRRRDNLALLSIQLLAVLFWFHPLIWLARELMRRDMEISCDEKAVTGLSREKLADYSEALLACGTGRHTAIAASMGNRKSVLALRIKAVLTEKKKNLLPFLAAVFLCLATVMLCFPIISGSSYASAASSSDGTATAETTDPHRTAETPDTIDTGYQMILEKHVSFAENLGASVSAVVTDSNGRILAQTGDMEMRAFPGSSLHLITAAALRQSLPEQLSSVNIFDHYLNWLTGVTNDLTDIEEIYLQADFKKAESFLREAGAGDLTFDSARRFYDYSTGQGQGARQYTARELNEMCRRIFEGETSLKGADLEELRQQSVEYLFQNIALVKDSSFLHIDISSYDPDIGLAGAVGTDRTETIEAIDKKLSYEESQPLYSYAFFSGFASVSGQNIYVSAIVKDDDTNSLFHHVTEDNDMAVFSSEIAFAIEQMFSELQGEK